MGNYTSNPFITQPTHSIAQLLHPTGQHLHYLKKCTFFFQQKLPKSSLVNNQVPELSNISKRKMFS